MKKTCNVSVVMCTYNGASRHLREQLDSIFAQTLLPMEIVAQDDGSTDDTLAILHEYAAKAPEGVSFRVSVNGGRHGINDNFLSAMALARGEWIAISDQDDIWMPTKIEEQLAAIGDNMMCVCRSVPFSDTGAAVRHDSRTPCCGLLRLLYASMPGHCQLLRKSLIEALPSRDEYGEIYSRTCYDVMTGTAAAALDSILMLDRVLVMQRRYEGAATYAGYDTRRVRSGGNAVYMAAYGLWHYRRVKPYMTAHFNARRQLLMWIGRKWQAACDEGRDPKARATARNDMMREGMRLLKWECRGGITAIAGLAAMYVRHRHEIFYTREDGPMAVIRALLHPFMQVYNYRYLVTKVHESV